MTLVASLLFAIALFASIAVIYATLQDAMPRIAEVIELEFAPAVRTERRVIFGEIKGQRSAEIIAFPQFADAAGDIRLAA
jgi:hypothetical protein